MENTEKSDGDTTNEDHEGAMAEGPSQSEIEGPGGEPSTVCQFFLAGQCRFGDKCRNNHTGSAEAAAHLPANKDKKGARKNTSEPKGKKPPMKTASDVINRIQWDEHLPKERFSVGYLDRFLGVIEKPFSAFCWEDLASTGVDVLAIPKHRIQYFKYGGSMVWDKTSRTDNVFGSTGSGLTILDIIEQHEAQAQAEGNDEKNMEGASLDLLDVDEEEEEESKNKDLDNQLEKNRRKKMRPTHFIAVRISSEEVRSSVKEVQDVLLNYNADMKEFFAPLQELHLTVCLLHLDTPDEIEIAHNVLQETKTEIQRILPPSLILSFNGLKDFHSRVLYLAPTSVPGLPSFANTLSQNFRSRGLVVIDPPTSNSFHVSIAKVPRNVASKNPSLLFLPEVYNSVHTTHFGAQHIDHLSFCYAGNSRRTDGFYTTLLELPLY
ncbi:leukocyte receptor cluster member 9 isoform X2 [Hyperolius riggenbachi]